MDYCWGLKILGDLWGLIRAFTTSAGERESFMTFLGNKENSDDLYWGIKTWEASTGEMRTRIFVLLGNNSVGRILIPLEIFQELRLYANLLGF